MCSVALFIDAENNTLTVIGQPHLLMTIINIIRIYIVIQLVQIYKTNHRRGCLFATSEWLENHHNTTTKATDTHMIINKLTHE